MRILIAPDKFKGTLTQHEACTAIRRGVERAAHERGIEVEIDECPVADGGEGTLEAIHASVGAGEPAVWLQPTGLRHGPECLRGRAVMDPPYQQQVVPESIFPDAFENLVAFYESQQASTETMDLWMGSDRRAKRAAYIETADVLGLQALSGMDLEIRSTAMLGPLLERLLCRSVARVVMGLGGSGTVDGGIGVAERIGVSCSDVSGQRCLVYPFWLKHLARIEPLPPDHIARTIELIALCDVQNPLLGPRGAARMFGPQKGATPEQVERLEAGLENLVRVCRECGIPCDPDQPGAGAAGGLGFGLATFLGAKLVPGAPYILDLLHFDERCAAADLIITGEGKMDMQTAEGKACAEAAKRAAKAGKPCIAVVGTTEGEPEVLRRSLAQRNVVFQAIHRASADVPTAEDAARSLESAAYGAVIEAFGSRMP